MRFHTCYGINEGPRIFDARLKDVVGHMLKVKARFYSFEGANARHEHEYHVLESVRLPAGKVLIPGVITHGSNIVEHPELIVPNDLFAMPESSEEKTSSPAPIAASPRRPVTRPRSIPR